MAVLRDRVLVEETSDQAATQQVPVQPRTRP